MKFAIVNGQKSIAIKGTTGRCPSCDSEMIAKCGDVKAHYWAHKSNRYCDHWWENETQWHRNWKNQFPESWQEVVHKAANGEKHIADIKTDTDLVIEFQHSKISKEEYRSRLAFYQKMVWVVDGTRLKTYQSNFHKKLKENGRKYTRHRVVEMHFPDECKLVNDWANSAAIVFIDFSGPDGSDGDHLWFMYPFGNGLTIYFSFILRSDFIKLCISGNLFEEVLKPLKSLQAEKQRTIRL